jgi:DNA-binding NtrC family response regulator
MKTVLIVDDKEMMRDSVCGTLERAGFKVVTAADGESAVEHVAKHRPDAVVSDMRMPSMTGLQLIERIRQIDDDLPVILMTAFGTIDTAVKAMKLGAFDYITKPFEGDELVIAVRRAIEHRRLVRENAVLRVHAASDAPPVPSNRAQPLHTASGNGRERRGIDRLVGSSGAMQALREQIKTVAQSHGTVLITGESGVGKDVVARAVHEMSPRVSGSFLAVNCAALSTSLLESELFGHEKGAFTGAEKMRKGRFELADGGTLLLDEVSEVGPSIQAKLLRVLQERMFERVGSSLTIGVDVRVVATSNRDLPGACAKGEFRQDLFFRLNVLPLSVPPLRDRVEDVPELAKFFVEECCRREGRAAVVFSPDALELMQTYHWPGNVRELQNICERAIVLSAVPGSEGKHTVTREMIAPWLNARAAAPMPIDGHPHANGHAGTNGQASALPAQTIELKPTGSAILPFNGDGQLKQLEEIEREAIIQTLVRFKGHRQKTAHALGIGVRTLGLKLKKWKQTGLVAETL